MLDSMPVWIQFALAAFLVVYCIVSVYGRFNVNFGAKVFSKIPPHEIRSNQGHILQYTGIPLAVTIGYLILLWARHSGVPVSVTP
jgi:hypothetical protein